MPASFPPIIHRHKAVLISLERKEGKGFFAFFQCRSVSYLLRPLFFWAPSLRASGQKLSSSLCSLHPHLFPVLVRVGVIQLVLLARPTVAAVATVSKSGEQEERGAGCRYVGYWISRGDGGHVGRK